MSELLFYTLLLVSFGLSSLFIFIILFYITAPYGKHVKENWGPTINNKAGWFFMELPTIILYIFFFLIGQRTTEIVPTVFLLIWLTHYIHRALIFPFLLRGKSKMPVLIMLFGLIFNLINSYLQSRWINTFAEPYPNSWLISPIFIIGLIIFFTGFIINIHSDYIIRNLREPGETEHKIPQGGMFRWVSSPNYLGEIIEWLGWAILTWSIPGLVFAVWTFSNLAPRAKANHDWYKEKFEDYPEERDALIPYLL